jgi:LmbE family N-acetylglucosaminyl deacetylase
MGAQAEPVAILSPHLDDAVLGCWAELARAPHAVVVNVCAAIPPAGQLAYWDGVTGGTDSAEHMRERLAEDERALDVAGVERINLEYLDKHYRENREPLDVDDLRARILDALPERCSMVLAPAGIGDHVDHGATRDAVMGLREDFEVQLYADLPYCVRYGWPARVTGAALDPHLDVEATWAPSLKSLPAEWQARGIRLTEDEQRDKLEAIRLYATQYPGLTMGAVDVLSHPAILPFEVRWGEVAA